MPALHSLALPLSAHYARDARDGVSFFGTPTPSPSAVPPTLSLHPTAEAYLDDLCGFLCAARLIQAHPDNYFQFMRGETWAGATVHFDGSPVEAGELAHTQRLLSGFGPLLHGEDAMTKLRTLVRDGPPPAPSPDSLTQAEGDRAAALAALNGFYQTTRQLMLGRARRPESDAATHTLLTPAACAALDRHSATAEAAREHQAQILELVVSHGMNPKKQHEVRIMRDTIHDLVACCNADLAGTAEKHGCSDPVAYTNDDVCKSTSPHGENAVPVQTPPSASPAAPLPVETVINIGEGKGYVSRAVALCDNLQVVGLDCNPAHKERAVERFESLLETSLSSRDGRRPRVNLLYEPRGHVASIACRVEDHVDWTSLLRGHVLTCSDACCGGCQGSGAHASSVERSAAEGSCETEEGALAAATLSRIRGEETIKLACRLCGKVVRLESTTVIMKHVYGHLHEAAAAAAVAADTTGASEGKAQRAHALPPWIPSPQQIKEWNMHLSQHAYVAKLTETFFTVTDVETRHQQKRKDAALLKRPRESGDGADDTAKPESYLRLSHRSSASSDDLASSTSLAKRSVTVQPAYTARGYRAVLLVAQSCVLPAADTADVAKEKHNEGETNKQQQQHQEQSRAEQDSSSTAEKPTAAAAETAWRYAQVIATIVGYDGGADNHQVWLDGEAKKRSLRLYSIPAEEGEGQTSDGAFVPHQQPQLTLVTAALTSPSSAPPSSPPCASYIGDWQLPPPDVWGRAGVGLVLSVLPPALPSTPAVCVPSVRNTALIGLHPCGDLGSNVCRIFTSSGARALLLVSCCWHALTPHGFPLSHAMQRRGMTTDSVSLLLATQPLDAWSTASPEGHRSSAKLLFFRSLLKLLWSQLAQDWAAAHDASKRPSFCIRETTPPASPPSDEAAAPHRCGFPAVAPHLEPTFLRRMSKQKETLTFVEFVEAVAQEFLYKESARSTPFTPWNIGVRCAGCREAQEAFVRDALTTRQLPARMTTQYDGEHFAQFLGLTVLRMWMCHLVESLLLLDRTLYLHEQLCWQSALERSGAGGSAAGHEEGSAVSLVPLFDGALSPRMYGVLARRGGSACQ